MRTLKNKDRARFFRKYVTGESNDCWLWFKHKNRRGYGVFWFDGKNRGAHRVSYQIFYGKFKDSLCVLHRCDNPSCVNPEHLFLGTNLDNISDRNSKGRTHRWAGKRAGSANPCARLTESDVEKIKTMRVDGAYIREIANRFNISKTHTRNILDGKKWRISYGK